MKKNNNGRQVSDGGRNQEVLTAEKQALITKNMMNYADAQAHKFIDHGVTLEELQSAALYGLCEAALNYEIGSKASFKTFATYYIKKWILQAITDKMVMRIPQDDLEDVTVVSLDAKMPGGSKRMEESIDDMCGEICSDEPEWANLVADEVDMEELHQIMLAKIKKLMKPLTAQERTVITMYFGLDGKGPRSTNTISTKMGLHPERVRSIYNLAMAKMEMASQGSLTPALS